MNSTNIISNFEASSPINYRIEIVWSNETERFLKLEIFKLPSYLNKIPSNDVIDIGNNHLLGFMNELAIGMGTGRLALPSVSSQNKKIALSFSGDFLHEMSTEELLLLQIKIASTLDLLNINLKVNSSYIDKIEIVSD